MYFVITLDSIAAVVYLICLTTDIFGVDIPNNSTP